MKENNKEKKSGQELYSDQEKMTLAQQAATEHDPRPEQNKEKQKTNKEEEQEDQQSS